MIGESLCLLLLLGFLLAAAAAAAFWCTRPVQGLEHILVHSIWFDQQLCQGLLLPHA